MKAVEGARAAIARALAAAAGPAPDPEAAARAARDRLIEEHRARAEAAATAAREVEAARSALPFPLRALAMMGMGADGRRLRELAARAERLGIAAEVRRPSPGDLADAAEAARRTAQAARHARAEWEQGEGRTLVARTAALDAVAARVAGGDVALARIVAAGGLAGAITAERLRMEEEAAMAAAAPPPPPVAPSPWHVRGPSIPLRPPHGAPWVP